MDPSRTVQQAQNSTIFTKTIDFHAKSMDFGAPAASLEAKSNIFFTFP